MHPASGSVRSMHRRHATCTHTQRPTRYKGRAPRTLSGGMTRVLLLTPLHRFVCLPPPGYVKKCCCVLVFFALCFTFLPSPEALMRRPELLPATCHVDGLADAVAELWNRSDGKVPLLLCDGDDGYTCVTSRPLLLIESAAIWGVAFLSRGVIGCCLAGKEGAGGQRVPLPVRQAFCARRNQDKDQVCRPRGDCAGDCHQGHEGWQDLCHRSLRCWNTW